jgi:hypothetical protein
MVKNYFSLKKNNKKKIIKKNIKINIKNSER